VSAVWPVLVAICAILVAGSASAHVILHKRDVRAAIGWVGLIWLVPFAGAGLYGLLGINRIQRRAAELRLHRSPAGTPLAIRRSAAHWPAPPLAAEDHHLAAIARLIDTTAGYPLTFGNAVEPLPGVAAYDAMIEAIAGSRRTVAMSTYIFDNDRAGRLFADALEAAVGRGVLVRVLIDGVGARYSFPAMTGNLRARNIPVAEFLPTFVPVHMAYANLRNHRKILVVDGRTGFTGGMNVRRTHLLAADRRNGTADTHFRIEGPVVAQLTSTFADDWAFCTGERLPGPEWFPPPAGDSEAGEGEAGESEASGIAARGIAAGPDEDFERIRYAILAALSQAQRRIRIVSPYFVPEPILMTSLALAAMRGVEVEICVPRRNNLRLVQWASRAKVGQLLAAGCRVWQTPPPFDHSKLMTVDGTWSLIGSANWDQRSLRLNFEFNVECYDRSFAARLDRLIDEKKAASRPLLLEQIEKRSLAVKLRDGAAWLLSPYL
jgi:cardiolipin synthase